MNEHRGIIVKSVDYKDYSKLIYIVNKNGIETLLVKGAKRPKSRNFSYSQVLTLIEYAKIETKTFHILTTGTIINNYSNIKNDYNKTKSAYFILELAFQFASHIERSTLFYEFLLETLQLLNDLDYPESLELIFRLKLLYLLGIGPQFSRCVICMDSETAGLSLSSGGVKCNKCIEGSEELITGDLLTFIKLLYLTKMNNFTNEFFEQLPNFYENTNEFLNAYYDYFLGYTSKVAKVFDSI